jgi:hypothetical protein
MKAEDYLPKRCVYCGDRYYNKFPLRLTKGREKLKRYVGKRTCSRECSRSLAKLQQRLRRALK